MNSRDATLDLLSDGHTAAPLIRLAYLHSLQGGQTYLLHFHHQTSGKNFPQVNNNIILLKYHNRLNFIYTKLCIFSEIWIRSW